MKTLRNTCLEKVGISFQSITKFLTDADLCILAANKQLAQVVNQESRWKDRIKTQLERTLYVEAKLADLKKGHPSENKTADDIFISLRQKNIFNFKSILIGMNKLKLPPFNEFIHHHHLILLSGQLKPVEEFLTAHRERLLKAEAYDQWYLTILQCIAIAGNPEILRLLASMGCNLHRKDPEGNSVPLWSALSGNPQMIQVCDALQMDLHTKSNQFNTVSHYAAWSGNPTSIKLCRQMKLNMKTKTEGGQSIIHFAVRSGNIRAVALCDQMKFDMSERDYNHANIAHYAASRGSKDILLYCYRNNIDVTECDDKGRGVQHYAAWSGNVATLYACHNTLKLNMNACDYQKKTVPHYAAISGNGDAIIACNEMKLNMASETRHRMPTIIFAALSGQREALIACKKINLDMHQMTPEGVGVQHVAAQSGSREAILTCKELNLDMTKTTRTKKTCQHYAAQSGSLEAMLTCLDLQLDMNVKTEDDKSIQTFAAESGNANAIFLCDDLKLPMRLKSHAIQYGASQSGSADAIWACHKLGLDMSIVKPATNGTLAHYTIALNKKDNSNAILMCDHIKMNMKQKTFNQMGLQHVSAIRGKSKSLFMCWVMGLEVDDVTVDLAMKSKNQAIISEMTWLLRYINFPSKYMTRWKENESQGFSKQTAGLIGDYKNTRWLHLFKPKFLDTAAQVERTIDFEAKQGDAESLFHSLSNHIFEFVYTNRFCRDDLIVRMLFCVKMLFPLMLNCQKSRLGLNSPVKNF